MGELLAPIVDRLTLRVKSAWIVRTDASGLKVLDPTSPENIEKGTMWCYVGDDKDVVFEFAPTGEGATGPWKFLSGRTGYIQADASNTFDRLFNGLAARATELGCWFHARRGLAKLKDTDCRVAYPLILIGRMFKLETLADVRRLTPEQRAALRQERCPPILQKLKAGFGPSSARASAHQSLQGWAWPRA